MRGVGNWLALAVLIRVPAEIGYEHSHPGTCMCLRVLFFLLIFHFSFFSGYGMEYLCHGCTNIWSLSGGLLCLGSSLQTYSCHKACAVAVRNVE